MVLAAISITSAATAAAEIPAGEAQASVPPPGLSITLADGTAQTRSGATLTYTASVTNEGANPLEGTLEITIPAYATYTDTKSAPAKGPNISWPVTIGAGNRVSEEVTVNVGTIPKTEVRFTSIATLYAGLTGTDILVRTADPDAIRGVVDPAHTVGQPAAAKNQPVPALAVFAIILGVVVLIVVVIGCIFWTRKRRRSGPPAVERDSTHDGGAGLVGAASGRPGVKGEGDDRRSA
ncbi:MAG TPA: hypothetical protein VHU90_11705 [Galbitalea sp.]|jgi:hypothetical protein|nr:hypothetical protein [Galbitalea sp.]